MSNAITFVGKLILFLIALVCGVLLALAAGYQVLIGNILFCICLLLASFAAGIASVGIIGWLK